MIGTNVYDLDLLVPWQPTHLAQDRDERATDPPLSNIDFRPHWLRSMLAAAGVTGDACLRVARELNGLDLLAEFERIGCKVRRVEIAEHAVRRAPARELSS